MALQTQKNSCRSPVPKMQPKIAELSKSDQVSKKRLADGKNGRVTKSPVADGSAKKSAKQKPQGKISRGASQCSLSNLKAS